MNDFLCSFKGELLCQLSDLENFPNTVIICATNCPWDLDTAFIRRFHKEIYIPLPDCAERLEFLQLFTENTKIANTLHSWDSLVSKTEGFSGSDLRNLVRHALSVPIIELENTKIWKIREDGFYEAIGQHDFSSCICCDVTELPPKTVVVRDVELKDFMSAVHDIRKTVSDSDIQKYEKYRKS